MNFIFKTPRLSLRPFRQSLCAGLLALAAMLPVTSPAAGTWSALSKTAPGGVGIMLLLPSGSVMCANYGGTGWYLLTPDIHGSYVNGTWSTLAPMHNSRLYYSSEVLPSSQIYVAGGEYGTGGSKAEMYSITNNAWTQLPTPPDDIIDNISETLPNGDVLEGSPSDDSRIFSVASNSWSAAIKPNDGQDEASWVKLQDGSIVTIDPFGTNTERFIPSLNKWVTDSPVPVPMYGYGGELGPGLLLPTGQAIFFGASGSNCVYTPWTTNQAGTYTPNGTTNAGTWTTVASTPNFNAPIDAPAAMMVNGNILACMANTNNGYGSDCFFYEYNYVTNSWTAITSPTGGSSFGPVAFACVLLDLPDGSVLLSSSGSQLYDYKPSGPVVMSGVPTIVSVTTNLDGSFHMTGTLFNGISEGAAYGDDNQMDSDYPVARMTNAAGNTLYCRTFNWSTCDLMTGTNVVSTEMALPPGLLAGTYPLVVTANGISSAPYSLTTAGTPLPSVASLAFTLVASNQLAFHWNDIGLTETGYVVKRSGDGVNYTNLAVLGSNVTNYTDTAVAPLGEYYYEVMGTNAYGLGLTATPIFAATPPGPGAGVAAPWSQLDIGPVLGSGATGTNAGVFTVIGSGTEIGEDGDQFQFACQPMAGDVTITARITSSQNTGSNALAGVMIRNGTGSDVAGALMAFNAASQTTVFEHRADSAGVAGYGLKYNGDDDDLTPAQLASPAQPVASDEGDDDGNGIAIASYGANAVSVPVWLQLVRTGNTITGYTSPDGTNWTPAGTVTFVMSPVVEVGLAVTSGTYNLLNASVFDNVTVTGTPSTEPIPMAEWKLDETGGTMAEDSIDSFDGTLANVTLGLTGATPETGYAAGFNGVNADISVPALNLNTNTLTITTWMYRTTNEPSAAGVFFNRANSTVSGLNFYASTGNQMGYTWNGVSGTYNWQSGLIVPSNTWTFVALVIEPTRARLFMATNGVLQSATNNVANAVQAFNGISYIGWDSLNTNRYFNGELDQVQFFNQVLTPAQLAQFASSPGINLTSPTNGGQLQAFGSFNLSCSLSATNGHTVSSVQYYTDEGQLLAESSTPPYAATATNLNVGSYVVFSRLFYDTGFSVDSPLNNVTVSVQPSTTNQWDANGSLSGAQDGSGSWGGGTNWWNGTADTTWADYTLAVFGAGTTTNCTVTITNPVTPYAITFNAGTGSYTLAGTNAILLNVPGTPLEITANGNATISAPLQGANSLVKLGTGTLTLNAAESYAGTTTVAAGLLKLGTNAAFGSGITVSNTGTVDLAGQDFTATMFGLPFTLGGSGAGGTAITNSSSATRAQVQEMVLGGNATIGGANTLFIGGTNAVNGVLDLNGYTLTKAGSGTVVLNGLDVTGAGNITVNAGTVQLQDNYSGGNQQSTTLGGTGNLTIGSGASVMTYKWGATLAVTMPMVLNGGTLGSGWPGPNGATYACPITINTNSTFNFGGGYDDCTFSGSITGPAGLSIIGGSSTRTFTGMNSYGWTTISDGVLKIGSAGATGTLGLGNVTNNATLTFSRTNALPVTNRISGTGAVIQSGTGTVTLYGTNLFTGGVTLSAGTLNVSAPETVGTSGPLGKSGTILFGGGTLQYSTFDAADYSPRFSTATNQPFTIDTAGQTVSFAAGLKSTNGGSFTKLGAGALTLAGTNVYDGLTTVSAGTLLVNGLIYTNATTVFSGATLGGIGSLAGPVTVQFGATLAPGASGIGRLTVSNNLVLAGQTLMQVALNGSTPTNDTARVTGALTEGGSLTVTNSGTNALIAGNSFKLFNAGTYTGAFTNLTLPALTNGLYWYTNNLAAAGVIAVSNYTYTLTYLAGTNGSVSGTTPQTVIYGAGGSAVTAVPVSGYGFIGWSDGSTANPRTDSDVTSNLTVTADFTSSPLPAPVLQDIQPTVFGGLTLGGTGVVGQVSILMMATNLVVPVQWTPVATNTAGANGQFNFSIMPSTNEPQQFYRLMTP